MTPGARGKTTGCAFIYGVLRLRSDELMPRDIARLDFPYIGLWDVYSSNLLISFLCLSIWAALYKYISKAGLCDRGADVVSRMHRDRTVRLIADGDPCNSVGALGSETFNDLLPTS